MKPVNLLKIIPLVAAALLAATPVAGGKTADLGVAGRTYRIAEPNAMAEIKAAVAKTDWRKFVDREKAAQRIKQYRPTDLRPLPPATADRSFLVDMTYTLDMDIPDGKGGVLYSKGYSFNPLDHIKLTSTLVILDGSSREQLDWFASSGYADDYHARLIITDGSFYDLIEKLDRPVYYLPAEMVARLKLAAVPSVVQQQGKKMQVREYLVPLKQNHKEALNGRNKE